MGVANSREMGHLKTEFGSVCVREKEWRESCEQLERKVEQLTSENDTLREHHLSQVIFDMRKWSFLWSYIATRRMFLI